MILTLTVSTLSSLRTQTIPSSTSHPSLDVETIHLLTDLPITSLVLMIPALRQPIQLRRVLQHLLVPRTS
jgi:hypothetical protein